MVAEVKNSNESGADLSEIESLKKELEETKQRLKETELRYKTLNDQLPVGVYRTALNGQVLYGNPALAKILGYSVEELGSLSVAEVFVDPGQRLKQLEEWKTSGGVVTNEIRFKRGDGEEIWIRDTGRVILDEQGKVDYFDGIIEDITQDRIMRKRMEAHSRLTAVGQLAGGIAHDFNNVLFAMMSNAEFIMRSPNISEKDQHRLKRIQQIGDQAAHMIRQVMDFSRQSPNVLSSLDLALVVRESVEMLGRATPSRIPITLEIEKDNYRIECDLDGIRQILTNLTLNARDAMPDGGTIMISLSTWSNWSGIPSPCLLIKSGEWAILKVADQGAGIPEGIVSRVYEPFFTTKQSTGLGLAQVYGIVKRYGGYVDLETSLNKGTEFAVYLPLQPTESQPSSLVVEKRD